MTLFSSSIRTRASVDGAGGPEFAGFGVFEDLGRGLEVFHGVGLVGEGLEGFAAAGFELGDVVGVAFEVDGATGDEGEDLAVAIEAPAAEHVAGVDAAEGGEEVYAVVDELVFGGHEAILGTLRVS